MGFLKKDISRRQFIGGALALAAASAVPSFIRGAYKPTQSDSLQVWTCGGLSEAFLDLNQVYTMHTGHNIQYTGAFAGAIGKSLLAEKSRTEVFGARGLDLAKNMRKKGVSIAFEPLCFTDYVIVTPKGESRRDSGLKGYGRTWCTCYVAPRRISTR